MIVNFADPGSCRSCYEQLLKMREDGVFTGVKSIAPSYIQGFAEPLVLIQASTLCKYTIINKLKPSADFHFEMACVATDSSYCSS